MEEEVDGGRVGKGKRVGTKARKRLTVEGESGGKEEGDERLVYVFTA